MKTVYAFLADGVEEVEALMVVDLLKRTKKLDVVMVSIKEEPMVEGSHNIKFFADKNIYEIDFEKGDCIFLPGGAVGTENLASCKELTDQILKYNEKGKWLMAICAAPSVYSSLGLLKDKKATSYPTFSDKMDCKEYGGAVVTDKNFITAKGLGVALELGLEMIKQLVDEETSEMVAEQIKFDTIM